VLEENGGRLLSLLPDVPHAAGRIEREAEQQRDVVGGEEAGRLPIPAVLAHREVSLLQVLERLALLVGDQDLELHQVHLDLLLEGGADDQRGVVDAPAIGQLGDNPHIVFGAAGDSGQLDPQVAKPHVVGRQVGRREGRGLGLVVEDGGLFELRLGRHRDVGFDEQAAVGRRQRLQGDREWSTDPIDHQFVAAEHPGAATRSTAPRPVGIRAFGRWPRADRLDAYDLLAGWRGQWDLRLPRRQAAALHYLAVEVEDDLLDVGLE